MQRNLFCASAIACVMLSAISCKKDDTTTQPTVALSATSQTVSEAAGTASITITLPSAQSTDVTIKATLGGTAILNGDYQVSTDTTLTIAAGSTSAILTFEIFDDEVVESDKTINVTFSSSNATLSNSTASVTITDNDSDQSADGLVSELTWDAGSLADMDLYLANNVTITDNTVTDYNLLSGSTNTSGFESLLLSNDLDDADYYVLVYFAEGAREVTYTLTNRASGNTVYEDTYSFTADEVGGAYFYGPFTKSGTAYSIGKTANSVLWDVKLVEPHWHKGKIAK
ncbi:Calx-beta domain-containing protein [Chitinophaga sancti]|uniref:Calx-beta domain-containing protein n=1 Tax=Chitinophaga sancti TaxID=1004 RepID=A0A1K1RSW9_9BACT|nr:Calx-beta domain-containing protein [Chitinophaga sancti]WQD62423.1 Calx-beta domain-containing protein [Chitinophaga sancti]WQG92008.1 Calx-beta domain-containing protein [Chitinophaga sancti]SFW75240.1 Calx-beta domain-containing protein [Chitinophaga sancti]